LQAVVLRSRGRSGRGDLPLYVFCLHEVAALVGHHPGQRGGQAHAEIPFPALIFSRSSPSCSRSRRSHPSCALRNSGNNCCVSWIAAGGRTFFGARIVNLGGGSAIQTMRRPLGPMENGPRPDFLCCFPLAIACAIRRCTTVAVALRWARHSAIDHLFGAGRKVRWPGVRPLTRTWARWRQSAMSWETDSGLKIIGAGRSVYRMAYGWPSGITGISQASRAAAVHNPLSPGSGRGKSACAHICRATWMVG
jgi:hypothetical protein